ncbi:F5J5.1 [Cucumis melo var. makuwa]|uniref:F5J5.1 n=1 Tax=Cucumis melo var. makuwa TaxID=1194695 RepID=A0A5A7V4L4_CUCMM|nr:F5J5.1 [Cucumis melo var. makuwa]
MTNEEESVSSSHVQKNHPSSSIIDEKGSVTKDKTKLVAQVYSQVEGVGFDETFAPVARLETIRLVLGLSFLELESKSVNTRRGKYQVRSTSVGSEDDSSRMNMHGVSPPDPTKESLFPNPVDSIVLKNVGHYESNVSDMDSNESDDVPLIHILKQRVFGKNTQLDSGVPGASNIIPSQSGHSVSLHSSSSSSKNNVPASNIPHHSSDNFFQGLDNVDQESNPEHVEPESVHTSNDRAS